MRKWLAFGAVAIALAGGTSWYFGWWQRSSNDPSVRTLEHGDYVNRRNDVRDNKNDSEAEPADTIEPLVVENRTSTPVAPTSLPELEAPPVYLAPGMKQAPRPDAARAIGIEEWPTLLPWPFGPIARMLQGTDVSKWKLWESEKAADPTEEAEPKEVTPPVEAPLPLQVPDYHHQYPSCPYTGGHCPIPYPYYPRR